MSEPDMVDVAVGITTPDEDGEPCNVWLRIGEEQFAVNWIKGLDFAHAIIACALHAADECGADDDMIVAALEAINQKDTE